MAAATACTGEPVMTSRPRTYRMVVDGEAWPRAGGDFEDVGAGVDGAGGEGVPQGVRVQAGDAGAVADPADQAVRSSRVHRGAGAGGEQRPGEVAAVGEPVGLSLRIVSPAATHIWPRAR